MYKYFVYNVLYLYVCMYCNSMVCYIWYQLVCAHSDCKVPEV